MDNPQSDVKNLFSCKEVVSSDSQGNDTLEVMYDLSQNLIDKILLSSEFIFISRTIINETLNEYWPNQNGTEEHYMAYRFSATDWLAPTGELMIAERVSDTLGQGQGNTNTYSNGKRSHKTWKR